MPFEITGNGTSPVLMPEGARKCPACGLFTHQWDDIGQLERSVKRDWDVSMEGTQLISERFKAALDRLGVVDVEFKSMPKGGYAFRPKRAVFLDLSVYGVETEGPCQTCGQLTAFLGGNKAKILKGETVEDFEIVRSAQSFGSEDYRAEFTIFGDGIRQAIKDVQVWRNVQWQEVPFS